MTAHCQILARVLQARTEALAQKAAVRMAYGALLAASIAAAPGCRHAATAEPAPSAYAPRPEPQDQSFAALFGPNYDYPYFEEAGLYPFRPDAEGWNSANAWWLADAAMLAYAALPAEIPEDSALRSFVPDRLAAAGLGGFQSWVASSASGPDVQAYAAWNESFAIVAFRGTEPARLRDFLSDFDARLAPWEGPGRVHRGFLEALDAIWPQCAPRLRELQASGCALWFTGHSMGGALATLAAARIGPGARLATFGGPRVGDRDFARSIPRSSARIVNGADLVAGLPPGGFYRHGGTLYYFDRKGSLKREPRGPLRYWDQFLGRGRRIRRAASRWMSARFDAVPLSDLSDHAPVFYAIRARNHLAAARTDGPFQGADTIKRFGPVIVMKNAVRN